jgi:hypothetical protein
MRADGEIERAALHRMHDRKQAKRARKVNGASLLFVVEQKAASQSI